MSIMSQSSRTLFNGYNVTASAGTYVYNASGGSAATSGLRECKADEILVHVEVATLNAASLFYRIEGRFDGLNRWAEIYSATITTADTIGKLVNVTERPKEIRVGARINATLASPNNLYCGIVLSEYK